MRVSRSDDFGDMQAELAFTNPLGDVPALDVTYALKDAEGVRFHTDSARADLPAPDERFRDESDTVPRFRRRSTNQA
ncbi:MAG: hypothetical protein ACR2JP_00105 [Acidimicrobiia bacterium]